MLLLLCLLYTLVTVVVCFTTVVLTVPSLTATCPSAQPSVHTGDCAGLLHY